MKHDEKFVKDMHNGHFIVTDAGFTQLLRCGWVYINGAGIRIGKEALLNHRPEFVQKSRKEKRPFRPPSGWRPQMIPQFSLFDDVLIEEGYVCPYDKGYPTLWVPNAWKDNERTFVICRKCYFWTRGGPRHIKPSAVDNWKETCDKLNKVKKAISPDAVE